MDRLLARMVGIARFDAQAYEDVEADPRATAPAIALVILSSVAAALGVGAFDLRSIAGLLAGAILSWMIWVLLTLFIGTQILKRPETHTNYGEIVRTTGFSASVGILRIFGILPIVGIPIFVLVNIWMLMTFVIAIRQALDYTSTGRALAVCLLGWLLHAVVFIGFVRMVG